ncbi:hypothetical protein Anas_05907 [Armadillidium nasatum]|uniref:Uncharacterized protein n=1 Tax=Armadillidium nasatum TaxID=96803 RepID=A0A5N5TPE0_9CRUS|nr:hypothetical protein Anas_05907 [Armadillidium nasatum]
MENTPGSILPSSSEYLSSSHLPSISCPSSQKMESIESDFSMDEHSIVNLQYHPNVQPGLSWNEILFPSDVKEKKNLEYQEFFGDSLLNAEESVSSNPTSRQFESTLFSNKDINDEVFFIDDDLEERIPDKTKRKPKIVREDDFVVPEMPSSSELKPEEEIPASKSHKEKKEVTDNSVNPGEDPGEDPDEDRMKTSVPEYVESYMSSINIEFKIF